jgi:hypothetical protein
VAFRYACAVLQRKKMSEAAFQSRQQGRKASTHPKGVHKHDGSVRCDSVNRSWKTELQHSIVHRHEAILVQKLQRSAAPNDGIKSQQRQCGHKRCGCGKLPYSLALSGPRTRSVIPPARLVCICGGPFPRAGCFTAQTNADHAIRGGGTERRAAAGCIKLASSAEVNVAMSTGAGAGADVNAPLHIVFTGLAGVRGPCTRASHIDLVRPGGSAAAWRSAGAVAGTYYRRRRLA